jgi:hypothetical protein
LTGKERRLFGLTVVEVDSILGMWLDGITRTQERFENELGKILDAKLKISATLLNFRSIVPKMYLKTVGVSK